MEEASMSGGSTDSRWTRPLDALSRRITKQRRIISNLIRLCSRPSKSALNDSVNRNKGLDQWATSSSIMLIPGCVDPATEWQIALSLWQSHLNPSRTPRSQWKLRMSCWNPLLIQSFKKKTNQKRTSSWFRTSPKMSSQGTTQYQSSRKMTTTIVTARYQMN